MHIDVGTAVCVQMDDGSIFRTTARSRPINDGQWVVFVNGPPGRVTLDRVTEAWTELEDDWKERRKSMWHYQARRRTDHGEQYYEVIEVYREHGQTEDSVKPCGETKAELIADLERMLADVKRYRTIVEKEQLDIARPQEMP